MDALTIVVSLLLLLTLCSSVLRRFSIPYSTVMVLVGAAIAFIPGLPAIELPPELVLLVFLPPLLYSDAWYVTWHEFRNELPGILSLSVLLVMVTMTSVAVVAHALIPGMSWSVAFVLGAILSPTDAIAAAPIAHRMGLPRRLVVLIEGEGLVNDAAAIVAYRFAVAAIVTGVFSSTNAMTTAGLSTVGGIGIGLLAGWLAAQAHRVTRDARLETVITILTPFVAYIPAERIHLSGVLAVVTAGLYIGYRQAQLFTAETRLQAIAVWDVITFILNGLIFVLIGLQLPQVLEGVASYGVPQLAFYAALVCVTVVLTRMVWMYIGAGIERAMRFDNPLSLGAATILGWAGMRGAISLAAVLAIPTTLADGTPFPHRDLLAFLVFAVILFTLVLQSLSLPAVISASGLYTQAHNHEAARRARLKVAEEVVKSLQSLTHLPLDAVRAVAREYREDARRQRSLVEGLAEATRLGRYLDEATAHALRVEHDTLMHMKKRGEINDETLHSVLRDTDLREARHVRQARASEERHAEAAASPATHHKEADHD
jgi:monovalent cation/hydrogen antiporter